MLDPSQGNNVTTFATDAGKPVDLDVGPDGNLYYLSRNFGLEREPGALYRIRTSQPPITTTTTTSSSTTTTEGTSTTSTSGTTTTTICDGVPADVNLSSECNSFSYEITGESGPRIEEFEFDRDNKGRIIKAVGVVTYTDTGNQYCMDIAVIWGFFCISDVTGAARLPVDAPTTTSTTTTSSTTTTTNTSTTSSTSTTTSTTTTTCPAYYRDADGDSYGNPNDSIQDCIQPSDYVPNNGDCDDTDPGVNPGVTEICNDNMDNDCDGLEDCNDTDCVSLVDCTDTTYFSGVSSVKYNYRRASKDKASLWLCIDECFCEALNEGSVEIVLELWGCDQITIPASELESNTARTKFRAKTSTYKLKIDCVDGWLHLRLKNANLKDCVFNPIEICVYITGGQCLCAEEEFEEQLDKRGRLKKLYLDVSEACQP